MDISLDSRFKKVENLKWLPWVGDKYFKIPTDRKLLIIGESHYHDGTKDSIEKHEHPDFTREIVEDLAVDGNYYDTKMFQNIHKVLFRHDDFDHEVLWSLVSFYNFMQRPMNTNLGRPNYDDYVLGWKILFQVADILRPQICLFIGTGAANYFPEAVKLRTDFRSDEISYDACIGTTYTRTSNLHFSDSESTKLIFIRHTSQYFSWDKWNVWLKTKMDSQIDWMGNEIKANIGNGMSPLDVGTS